MTMIIDFHIHSKYSFDCFLEPSKIIELARHRRIDGIAVTDHGTMAGISEFRKYAPDFYIIAGQEISTKDADILGLFLKEEIRAKDTDRIIDEIRAQGGLAILAHPFKWPHLIRRDEFLKKFDCLEVFNARNNIPSPYLENFLARRAVQRLGYPFVAGSDAHEGFELGQAGTIFNFSVQEADDEKIKKALLEKRVKVTGNEVSLTLEVISHFSRILKTLKQKR